ncbi:MAG: hypothetical protein Kilf2KO_14280 [Rhodospirillales bacterium]
MPTSPEERLYRIVEDGMCIGCGLCQSVAGPDRVRMETVASGYQRPVVVGRLEQGEVDRIYDVCPGTRLEGLPSALEDEETKTDLVWGPYRRMVLAHASDPEVRWRGSTGGVLTALGQYLVESGEVAFLLHAKPSTREATFGERHVSFTARDVLAGAGSRYGPTAPLIDITELLARGEPFALVGKPCDIAALRNLARHDPRVDALVRYWLTPVCGGFMPPEDMKRFFKEREGLDPESVTAFRYRGQGCPGLMRYDTADGRSREFRYTDFWGTDESQWTLPFRCKVCPDGIGEAADIAASDTWPGGSPDPATEDQDPGTNAVIVRTAQGMALLEAAAAAGYVTLGESVDPRYLDGVQPHQTKKKLAVRARWDGLRDEGHTVPQSARLRLDALMATTSADEQSRQREGTRRRVRAGKASEARPSLWPAKST